MAFGRVGTYITEHWSRLFVCATMAAAAGVPVLLSLILIIGGLFNSLASRRTL